MATNDDSSRYQVSGKPDSGTTGGEGRFSIDFDLLDDDAKKRVIDCIQTRGKISVVLDEKILRGAGEDGGFRQLID